MINSRLNRRYGWHADIPDHRDHFYAALPQITASLPPIIDLRNQCPPVYDQGQLGSCHDNQTEVLTKKGWKLFKNLTENDLLASVDSETKNLIFEKPTRIIELPYDGPIHYGKHAALDFAVTPDHKMVVRKWNETLRTLDDSYSFINTEDIGWYCGLINSVSYKGDNSTDQDDFYILKGVEHKLKEQRKDKKIKMSAWLKFLGIYIAEGTMLKSYIKTRKNKNGTIVPVEKNANKIQIAASKEREKQFIRNVLLELDIKYLELSDRFTFSNKRLFTEMKQLGLFGVKAPQKKVPEFIFSLSNKQISNFLDGHFYGDGCEQRGIRSHYTSSVQLADDLQILIFLSGKWGNIYTRSPRISKMKDGRILKGNYNEHRISVWTRRNLSIDKKANIEIKSYTGMVYCAEVPTYHTLVTRRNGKILISGNCTSNAIAAAIEFDRLKQKLPDFMPSRLFIYYNERSMEGTIQSDAGAQIRDGVKSVATLGVCAESDWPYIESQFAVAPPTNVYTIAKQHPVVSYQRVSQTLSQLKGCLAAGYPFVFGISVYESFESDEVAKTGIVSMPTSTEESLGGHAILAVGYNDNAQSFIIRNSWGSTWGLSGYFTLPYSYVASSDLSDDFWTIRLVK